MDGEAGRLYYRGYPVETLARGTFTEAAHLLLSLVALTWFPIVHGRTFLRAVGLDPSHPGFAEQRRRHITTLLLGALRERAAAGAPASPSTWS